MRCFPSTKLSKTVVTIGNFDGVHLGHQKIIKSVVAKAKTIAKTNIVKLRLHYEPQKGNHKITIKVKDQASNLTEKIVPFILN